MFTQKLPGEFFTSDPKTAEFYKPERRGIEKIEVPAGTFAFKFLNSAFVVYHNPGRKNTYGADAVSVKSYKLVFNDGTQKEIKSAAIDTADAAAVRNKKVRRIDAFLK
jgi:hypothetical protein